MSDYNAFLEPKDSEAFPDNGRPVGAAQEQKKPERIVFYGKGGEVIDFELPSEEEIAELLYRLKNGDVL